jgi:diaminopimelate epimerase
MKQAFFKYQGAGNDFILIDNRKNKFPKEDVVLIKQLCDPKFGIGADGLMLLENSETTDFKMVYFNADGNIGSMCGNGGRCIVAFANSLNIFKEKTTFEAIGNIYYARMEDGLISLKMNDVSSIETFENYLFLNTGSPHHITFHNAIKTIDVAAEGRKIRNGAPYFEEGTNVNFVEQINENTFKVRTYERGVEDETLSCGTGVTAVAIASHKSKKTKQTVIYLETLGGNLEVSFEVENNHYKNIVLKGPATFVFKGEIEI